MEREKEGKREGTERKQKRNRQGCEDNFHSLLEID